MQRQDSSGVRCREARPAQAKAQRREGKGRPRTCPAFLLLPVDHLLHRAKAVAHVESSQIADVGNAQVEVEQLLSAPLHLHWHADSGVFALLHQSQVFQQTGSFLLARTKKNSDPSLDQG